MRGNILNFGGMKGIKWDEWVARFDVRPRILMEWLVWSVTSRWFLLEELGRDWRYKRTRLCYVCLWRHIHERRGVDIPDPRFQTSCRICKGGSSAGLVHQKVGQHTWLLLSLLSGSDLNAIEMILSLEVCLWNGGRWFRS